MESKKTTIRPPAAIDPGFRELWKHRELIYIFSWRDIKVKYKQTFFGIGWALFQPLGMMLLFSVVFSRAGFSVDIPGVPYPIFVLSGLIIWNLFNLSVSHAAESMVGNAPLLRKIYFPRLIIPLSSIATALFDFLIAFVLFILVCIF
ncbi:MAG TPA: ABC transporter permease, partial [Flavisolibacter sp.]|nr:ABC transporter permease [Flavisolibacter sp.]